MELSNHLQFLMVFSFIGTFQFQLLSVPLDKNRSFFLLPIPIILSAFQGNNQIKLISAALFFNLFILF